MPKHDFEFKVYSQGDYMVTNIASGYDPDIYNGVSHETNWWVHMLRHKNGDYSIDVQIGCHNVVLLAADRDGCRGVDEDRLEVTAKGRYRIDLLIKALGFVKKYETRIIYAMEWLLSLWA